MKKLMVTAENPNERDMTAEEETQIVKQQDADKVGKNKLR